MPLLDLPVPHLETAYKGPLHPIEKIILNQISTIEGWFRKQWLLTPPCITSSVDLRHAGFKIAPVDTNLFPAGFNNLNLDFMPLCIQAAQAVLMSYKPDCIRILLLPENHTRNQFYLASLSRLREILIKAGFVVRIGSLDPTLTSPREVSLENGERLCFEPLVQQEGQIGLHDFQPCLILLNNDLSTGIPEILQASKQKIIPSTELGWTSRFKSTHFKHYADIAAEVSSLIGIEPWRINPLYKVEDDVDFMTKEGLDRIATTVDCLLAEITEQYKRYDIQEKPFVVVKSDNGTYGMGVMMVQEAAEIQSLNRKQRTKMSSGKGSQTVTRVIIQEGVLSLEKMPDGAVAEPVIYMLGQYVIGGFYRVHESRGPTENLNAPGMHFEPLAFARACNMPREDLDCEESPNRFYVYGVIARFAALAAAREMAAVGG